MSYIRTPNLTGRVRRASAPAIPTSNLTAPMVMEHVAHKLRRLSLQLGPSAPSPSPSTMEQGAALRRMAPRDPSPSLELEPSFAEVGQLKRIQFKSPKDKILEPLAPIVRIKLALGFMPKLRSPSASTQSNAESRVFRVQYDSAEEEQEEWNGVPESDSL